MIDYPIWCRRDLPNGQLCELYYRHNGPCYAAPPEPVEIETVEEAATEPIEDLIVPF